MSPIPAFVNPSSGSAAQALAALAADPRFEARTTEPARLADAVRAEAARGTPRVAVSGGDGTIAQAVAAAAGTALEIAVLPGGTLNHFARDAGVPLDDWSAALEAAATGIARPVDLGYVNGRAILNTSAVGAYVTFVRTRERLERWLGYYLASFVAAIRVWLSMRGFVVSFTADDGTERHYHTPLVFVGVGERSLARDADVHLGARLRDCAPALHVLVVRESRPARIAALAFGALTRGLDALARTDALDAFLVDACTVATRRARGTVSIDGELVRLESPLRYSIARGAARVVVPAASDAPGGAA